METEMVHVGNFLINKADLQRAIDALVTPSNASAQALRELGITFLQRDGTSGGDQTTTLDELLQVGNSFDIYYGEGNPNNRRLHVRAIVDERIIVIRSWSERKQQWIYTVDGVYFYELALHQGTIRNVRRDED